eukprot:scaffold10373_cov118-Isochrysis_galbana.AAC.21
MRSIATESRRAADGRDGCTAWEGPIWPMGQSSTPDLDSWRRPAHAWGGHMRIWTSRSLTLLVQRCSHTRLFTPAVLCLFTHPAVHTRRALPVHTRRAHQQYRQVGRLGGLRVPDLVVQHAGDPQRVSRSLPLPWRGIRHTHHQGRHHRHERCRRRPKTQGIPGGGGEGSP